MLDLIKYFRDTFRKKDTSTIWREFSAENNGEFIEAVGEQMDRVLIQYKNLEIILDQHIDYRVVGGHSHDTHYVRARVMFKSVDDLYFRLSCQGLMDDIAKLFGAQDIRLGHEKMDSKFLVKGNDEFKVQQILSPDKIAPFLLAQQNPHLEIKKDQGMFEEPIEPGFAMLYFLTQTKFNEKKQLEELLEFIVYITNRMARNGSLTL